MTHPSLANPQQPDEGQAQHPPTGSQPPVPPQYPPPPPQYPPATFPPMAPPPGGSGAPSKTIGVLALIFGAAALLFGLIPLVGIFIGGLFGTAAIVLGIIGIFKSHKVMSIVGIALSVVATIVSISITASVVDDDADGIEAATATADDDTDAGEDAAADAEPEGDTAEPDTAGVDETVTDGDFEFTVSGFEQGVAEIGSEFLNEKAQGEFVIIDLTVKNIGSEAAYFSDSDQKLFDTDGNEYSANSAAGIYIEDNDIWLTEINPGNQVEGKIVFDVPAGTELASLELHDSFLSGGVEVSLQ